MSAPTPAYRSSTRRHNCKLESNSNSNNNNNNASKQKQHQQHDDACSLLADQFSKSCIIFKPMIAAKECKRRAKITDFASLSAVLPQLANDVFTSLGSQQLEATYQRCLKIDLQECGAAVAEEIPIRLMYKGRCVGTRRADLIITTPSGHTCIAELKAVDSIKPVHIRQLEYYMHHFGVDRGYVINFPHDAGFPSIDDDSCEFTPTALFGALDTHNMHGRLLRLKNSPDKVNAQIVELNRRTLSEQERRQKKKDAEEKERKAQEKKKADEENKNEAGDGGDYGLTKSGDVCKLCVKAEGFCSRHKSQAKGFGAKQKASR